ncbi:MAG: hypothetical protein ACKVOH_04715, partial [Chlamydiales bacterium]
FLPDLDHDLLERIGAELLGMKKALFALDDSLANRPHDLETAARFARDKLLLEMNTLRRHADALEVLVDDDYWPLPKYHEMLFIR